MNNTNFASKKLKGRGFSSSPRMNNYNQNGRSMIEMLGVLAIIGVLSVGGIAGYSKAMQRYRINKTIEQITLIAGNIRSFFGPQKTYDGVRCSHSRTATECDKTNGCSPNGCSVVKKAKIVPDEMLTVNAIGKITAITNSFGYSVKLYEEIKSVRGDGKAFSINYLIGVNTEACIELLTNDWTAANIKALRLAKDGSDSGFVYLKTPIDIDIAATQCSAIAEAVKDEDKLKGYLEIEFYFDIDFKGEGWVDIDWQN